ncbi:MAG: D-alanyl-D-alanine carboxypeptidase/D-alanyl-D-alanine-endopeptidase [Phycisphaerae bacterium]
MSPASPPDPASLALPAHTRRRTLAVCLFALLAAGAARAAEPPAARAVQAQLAALCQNLPQGAQVGLVVVDLATGQRWFEHDADTPLKPASVLKLFTTAAALDRFGPDFRYETPLHLAGEELWVIGSGDPGLGDERLLARHRRSLDQLFDEWAAGLTSRGVRSLQTLVLDDSIFDHEWRHPDWPADQSQAWYQAPVGGLTLNDNCLDARVVIRNGVIDLLLKPGLPDDFIENKLRRGKAHQVVVKRIGDAFEFTGVATRNDDLSPTAVHNPTIFFGYSLKHALERRGVSIRGDVVRRAIPAAALRDAPLIATNLTPLSDVVWRSNTFSQNLFAECLVKSLAAYEPAGRREANDGAARVRSSQPGSWPGGVSVMRATLERMGVELHGAVLRDGCGLSHQNRVTAAQVARLLEVMSRHAAAGVFRESLALAGGEEGSMKRRYGEPALRGRIRGKTGTIANVSTLAGYATRPDGTTLAFAILTHGPVPDPLLPRICRVLVAAGT